MNVELDQFSQNLGYGLYLGGTLWVMYLAIEPYARRLWPDGLLGWTRLFAGHIRDPRVGRDILIGCLFGIVESIIEHSCEYVIERVLHCVLQACSHSRSSDPVKSMSSSSSRTVTFACT